MKIAIHVEKLKKTYGDFVAVDEISFDLREGEILGLLGPNGSGKTTTIQMLLGTLASTSGTIEYFGKSLKRHRSAILQQVSYASTYTSLPHDLTIEENLRVFSYLYGRPYSVNAADPLLDRFGILSKKHSPVSSLSAGQITRLMLVKAFFTQPKIVLLDEPTASLDPEISLDVCHFILEQREKTGMSILFTSHKMEEVADVCDRTIFLKSGKIIADDLPKNLAKSISLHKVRLTITDGMKRTVSLAEARKIPYTQEHRTILFSLDDTEIPPFLQELMQMGVSYLTIQIQEPSLEDYFLHIADKQRSRR